MIITPKTKKIFYIFVAIFPLIIIAILGRPLKKSITKSTIVIPTSNNNENNFVYQPNNSLTLSNQNQTIKLILSNSSVDIKSEPQKIYKVTNSLVNEGVINSIISNLNFYDIDRINSTPEGDYLWINKNKSLFISTNQDQVIYTDGDGYQELSNISLNNEEIKNTSIVFIENLFGNEVLKTLNTEPKIDYLYLEPNSIEGEPKTVSLEKANLIAISFKQKLNDLPILTDSPNTEIVRVLINKNKKIVDLRVYGGYFTVDENIMTKPPTLNNIDTTKLHRITYTKDISSEKLFAETKQITLNVKNISSAYYYQNNGFLAPVIVLRGEMTAGRYTEPATYIYPLESSSESL